MKNNGQRREVNEDMRWADSGPHRLIVRHEQQVGDLFVRGFSSNTKLESIVNALTQSCLYFK